MWYVALMILRLFVILISSHLPLVSWVRCGAWLYRFLMASFLLWSASASLLPSPVAGWGHLVETASLSVLMCRYSRQSSAKRWALALTLDDRSMKYARNSRGPSTVPCGTQEVTGPELDDLPSTTIFWVLSGRKHLIHWSFVPITP